MSKVKDEQAFVPRRLAGQSDTRSAVAVIAIVGRIGVVNILSIDTHVERIGIDSNETSILSGILVNITKLGQCKASDR